MKKQMSFTQLESTLKIQKTFGGSLGGKRKVRRPLDCKRPIHLVLKATNSFTLLRNKMAVKKIIHRFNQKFGMRMHSFAIQYDHIHLNLSFQSRKIYVMWIRALTGALTLKIKNLKFKFLPFTRIIETWKRDFRAVQKYIEKNRIEADFLMQVHSQIESKQIRLEEELKRAGFIFMNCDCP